MKVGEVYVSKKFGTEWEVTFVFANKCVMRSSVIETVRTQDFVRRTMVLKEDLSDDSESLDSILQGRN
jgi:hypothetical protein